MYRKIILLALVSTSIHVARAQTSPIQWERTFGGANADFANVVQPTTDGGYMLGGYSYSDASANKTAASYGGGDYWIVKLDSAGARLWDSSYGGTNFDRITALQQTSDGGYILGGCSHSGPSGTKSSASYGAGDYWLVKVDANGNQQWEKTFGGTENDFLTAVKQTADGGYIVGGVSFSGASGNKATASFSPGSSDFWVLKLDANGNKQWEKDFGGTDSDDLQSLQQTTDGGYVLGGTSFSGVSGNKTSGNAGAGTSDYWVLKLDGNGSKQWDKSFGGNDAEALSTVRQTSDGGYIVGGSSYSGVSGNKTVGDSGSYDFWLVKLDGSGNRQWDRAHGGADFDELTSVEQSSDGGYMLGGVSVSAVSGNKLAGGNASSSGEYWMLKTDASGAKQWEQVVTATCPDDRPRLQSTRDGGYVVAGLANVGASGNLDYSIAKVTTPPPPPSFSSFSASGNVVQAKLVATTGANYVLEASTNFVNWVLVKTNTASGGVVNFTYTNPAGISKRFYRARQQ
jgi:hypothetical protein